MNKLIILASGLVALILTTIVMYKYPTVYIHIKLELQKMVEKIKEILK